MIKLAFSIHVYAKTKTQISFAVTAKLIKAFCFRYTDSTSLIRNSSLQPSSVAEQPGNHEDRFFHNEAQFMSVIAEDARFKLAYDIHAWAYFEKLPFSGEKTKTFFY